MQHFIENTRVIERAREIPPRLPLSAFTHHRLRVSAGRALFKPGELRNVYRVERGAISHVERSLEGQWKVIEFAFSGDLIGLGYLATHCTAAKALVDTTVTLVDDAELASVLQNDERLRFSLADAGEREFDFVRANAVSVSLQPPLQRLAYYLLAISGINWAERRDATFIAEDVASGDIANRLNMTIDTLAMALLTLKRVGILDASEQGLQIIDVAGLETVASGT